MVYIPKSIVNITSNDSAVFESAIIDDMFMCFNVPIRFNTETENWFDIENIIQEQNYSKDLGGVQAIIKLRSDKDIDNGLIKGKELLEFLKNYYSGDITNPNRQPYVNILLLDCENTPNTNYNESVLRANSVSPTTASTSIDGSNDRFKKCVNDMLSLGYNFSEPLAMFNFLDLTSFLDAIKPNFSMLGFNLFKDSDNTLVTDVSKYDGKTFTVSVNSITSEPTVPIKRNIKVGEVSLSVVFYTKNSFKKKYPFLSILNRDLLLTNDFSLVAVLESSVPEIKNIASITLSGDSTVLGGFDVKSDFTATLNKYYKKATDIIITDKHLAKVIKMKELINKHFLDPHQANILTFQPIDYELLSYNTSLDLVSYLSTLDNENPAGSCIRITSYFPYKSRDGSPVFPYFPEMWAYCVPESYFFSWGIDIVGGQPSKFFDNEFQLTGFSISRYTKEELTPLGLLLTDKNIVKDYCDACNYKIGLLYGRIVSETKNYVYDLSTKDSASFKTAVKTNSDLNTVSDVFIKAMIHYKLNNELNKFFDSYRKVNPSLVEQSLIEELSTKLKEIVNKTILSLIKKNYFANDFTFFNTNINIKDYVITTTTEKNGLKNRVTALSIKDLLKYKLKNSLHSVSLAYETIIER